MAVVLTVTAHEGGILDHEVAHMNEEEVLGTTEIEVEADLETDTTTEITKLRNVIPRTTAGRVNQGALTLDDHARQAHGEEPVLVQNLLQDEVTLLKEDSMMKGLLHDLDHDLRAANNLECDWQIFSQAPYKFEPDHTIDEH